MGPLTDAFVAAQAVPLFLFSILSVSLQSVWQPRLSVLLNDHAGWRETQGVAQAQTLMLFAGVAIPVALFSDAWIRVIFPGFDQEQSRLTSSMTLPLLAGAAFNCHSALLTTALRARDQFLRAEMVSLAGTLCLLGMTWAVVPVGGVEAAAWALCARAIGVFLVLHFQAGRPMLLARQAWRSREVWTSLRPLLAGSAIYKTSPLVDRYWTSLAPAGGVTVFNLAQTAMGALATILERAVCVPVVPQLARLAAREDYEGLRKAYRTCVARISLAAALTAVGMIALYPAWEAILAMLLKVTPGQAHDMWFVCLALLGYLHVAASGTIAVSAFYALDDTRTPVRIGMAGFILGVILKSAGFLLMGLTGLAIATSAYYICNMVAMCILLEKKIDEFVS